MKPLVIFGAGKVSEVIVDSIQKDARYEIVAICCDEEFTGTQKDFLGLPLISLNELKIQFPPKSVEVLVAIGYHHSNRIRAEKVAMLKSLGYCGARYIAGSAQVSKPENIGEFSIILQNATVQAGAVLGENVIVWDHGFVGHHATVDSHCWINTGVIICGNAHVKEYCYFGVNATVAHNITVGRFCFIGANALISQNAAEQGVYIVPGTERYRLDSDRFWEFSKHL